MLRPTPLNAAKNSPKVFIGNRYRGGRRGRVECWFQRHDDRRAGGRWWQGYTRGRAGEKSRGRGETRESRRASEGGGIKRHKVARSITRRAGPRVIFVRMNKSRSRMRACCEKARRGRLKRGDGPFIRGAGNVSRQFHLADSISAVWVARARGDRC